MLVDAYVEDGLPNKKAMPGKKPNPKDGIKESLLKTLNSKATKDDLDQIKYEKTNKTDTDMQMKSLDILHNQLLQFGTVLMELIK